jgi:signal transduction histidine kinase
LGSCEWLSTKGSSPDEERRKNMKLSNRLLLLLLVCLAPVIAGQVYTRIDLQRQRQGRLDEVGLHEVQSVDSTMAGIIEGARQLGLAVAQSLAVRVPEPGCAQQLQALAADLPRYRFIAVYDRSGAAICASRPGLAAADPRPAWLHDLTADAAIAVGRLTTGPADDGAFLPIGVPLPDHGWVVAALDLGWLSRQLDGLKASGVVMVTDREGAVLARYPASPTGRDNLPAPADLKRLVMLPTSGVATVQGQAGADSSTQRQETWLVAHSPATQPPVGIGCVVALYPPAFNGGADFESGRYVNSGIDAAIRRDGWVLALSALLALALAFAAGRRFVIRPTKALLAVARRWQDGDLDARVEVPERQTEFGLLGQSFNAMASTLQSRDQERRRQAETLEAQVAERTRALSDSNNRLQVEIAERERTQAALQQAQKLQAVGQIASGIAHDFNNMLATILGSLELMERRLPRSPRIWTEADGEKFRNLIDRAVAAVQRGAHLTSGLLAFSRRQRLSPRPTDLNRLVGDLVSLASSTLGRRIRVETCLATDLWPAQVDPSQVEAAILNLCLNARDAMPEGGQLTITTANETIAGRLDPDGPAAGDYVRICVTDSGEGMTPEVVRRAFDPFFTTKGPGGGSGLGLSQVYGTARQLGGTVRIRSEPGQGTEVELLLPRSDERAEQDAAPLDSVSRPAVPPCSVLVVDDDAAVRHVAVEMLKDLGCAVTEAPGGVEALILLDGPARDVEVAIIDYAMPGMNGLQLARALRARQPILPLVLATGYAELGEDSATLFNGLLRKPFTIRELEVMLARMRDLRLPSNVVPLRTHRRG